MNEGTDQLSETFVAHEHLAPDADVVLEKARGIARSMHRRRMAVRATGGAVLGVGLVAGGIALPGLRHSGPSQTLTAVQPASGDDSSAPAYTQDQEWSAYFAAGYDYNDAQQLAQLWNDNSDIGTIKAAAGLKLLEGQQLPIPPSGSPETPADQAQPSAPTPAVVVENNKDVAAYFAAGYDYNDAVKLGRLWHETDTDTIKADAGRKLLDGQTLPIAP